MSDETALTQELVPTDPGTWKKAKSIGTEHAVSLPSGNVALLRRIGVETFMKLGLIPNSLVSIIQEQITKAKGGDEPDEASVADEMAKLLDDPKKLQEIFELADGVLLLVCAKPKVHKAPDDEEERDEDKLYVDEVDIDDKMFIFSWAVGGAEDAATFRSESDAMLGAVRSSESVDDEAQPAVQPD